MGILDKLRPQARWKHGDPMVRLEAVQALADTELDVLAQVASEDTDARVRKAAVHRLADVDVLAAVTRNDADAGVREPVPVNHSSSPSCRVMPAPLQAPHRSSGWSRSVSPLPLQRVQTVGR